VFRTPELLGKSIVCPRCQSILQVPTTPQGSDASAWASSNNPILPVSFDSNALTKVQDSIGLSSGASEPSDRRSLSSESIPYTEEFALSEFAVDLNSSHPLVGPHATEDGPHKSTRSLQSSSDWVSPSTARKRLILLVGMTGLCATIIALVLFSIFLRNFSSTVTKIAGTVKPELPNALVVEPAPADPPPKPATAQPIAPNPEMEPSTEPPSGSEPQRTVAPEREIESNQPIPDVPIESFSPPVSAPPVSAPPLPRGVLGEMSLDVSEKQPTSKQDPPIVVNEDVSMAPPPGLARFAPIFEVGASAFPSEADTTETIAPEFLGGGGVVDLTMSTHPPAFLPPSWDEAKQTPIQKLVLEQPLSVALLVLSQLSGTGIGWDPQLVAFSPIDPEQKVSLDAKDSTIDSELTNLAKQVQFRKLIVKLDEEGTDQVLLVPQLNLITDKLPTEWSIEDLVTDDQAIVQWDRLLQVHFPKPNGAWTLEGKTIVWNENVPLVQKVRAALFLDQVRSTFGLPTKSGFFNNADESSRDAMNRLAWLHPTQAYDEAFTHLKKTGKSVFAEVISSPVLLNMAAIECDLELLLDWPALHSHGFSLAASNLTIFRKRTWPEIAKRIMDQFDLVAVVDGPHRLILTTLAQQRRLACSTVLPLGANDSIESIGESFRILSPTDAMGRSILSVTLLPKKDPADAVQYVVVRHCPPNTKQLQLLEVQRALRLTTERN